jgi:hypothetical protein
MTYRRWFSVIFALLFGTAAAFVAATAFVIHFVAQPGFAEHVSNPSVVTQERPFTMRGQNCEVVIDGDSATATGIDPRVITAETGLKACNLSSTGPIIDSLGLLPIDVFLRYNPAPKFLVLQLSPEGFYREQTWEHLIVYYPMVMLIRDTPRSNAVLAMLRHPSQTTTFVLWILQKELFISKPVWEERNRTFVRVLNDYSDRGFLTLPDPNETSCNYSELPQRAPPDTRWIEGLRKKYQAIGITLIIKSSPIPSCDPKLAQFQRDLGPLLDTNVQTLPLGYYLQGGRHINSEGSRLETLQLVQLLKSRRETAADKSK